MDPPDITDTRELKARLADWLRRDFENLIIKWKREHEEAALVSDLVVKWAGAAVVSSELGVCSSEYCQFLVDLFPENVELNEEGNVLSIDERVLGGDWMGAFERLRASDQMWVIGTLPGTDEDVRHLRREQDKEARKAGKTNGG